MFTDRQNELIWVGLGNLRYLQVNYFYYSSRGASYYYGSPPVPLPSC